MARLIANVLVVSSIGLVAACEPEKTDTPDGGAGGEPRRPGGGPPPAALPRVAGRLAARVPLPAARLPAEQQMAGVRVAFRRSPTSQ
jgi:hypothetical protein